MVHGWCYCQVADGIATAGWWLADVMASRQMLLPGQYFNFSSEMLYRTSSEICGRWYLPIFLFRDGSLTLIYRASLMVLMRFWSSLPTISKFSILMLWPVVLWWSNMGDGAFWCSLNLSPKVLEDSPIYSSSHSTLSHLYLYMTPLFFNRGSLSLGAIGRLLMVLPPLKYTCTPYFWLSHHL